MIHPNIIQSFDSETFSTAFDDQRYKLGYFTYNESANSSYSQGWIFAQATFDVPAYYPYFLGKDFELIQYSPSYQPESQRVVATQFDIKAGQYGFVLWQGEGLCQLEDTVAYDKGRFIRTEGDEIEFGKDYSAIPSSSAVGFLTEDQETGQNPVKCCLWGRLPAIPSADFLL